MRRLLRALLGKSAGPPVDLSKLVPLYTVTDDAIYALQVGSDGDVVLQRFTLVGEADAAFTPVTVWDAP